jgi:hypothetical protein
MNALLLELPVDALALSPMIERELAALQKE